MSSNFRPGLIPTNTPDPFGKHRVRFKVETGPLPNHSIRFDFGSRPTGPQVGELLDYLRLVVPPDFGAGLDRQPRVTVPGHLDQQLGWRPSG
jgi:hypothetical protein